MGRRRIFLTSYVVEPSGCWRYLGHIKPSGRTGCVNFGGKKIYAYRAFYLSLVGPIGEGLELDHLCRNPGCVNPEHLQPVTRRENGRRAGNIRLTESQVVAIKGALAKGVNPTTIARAYGVVPGTVYEIKASRNWRDVEAPA